MKPAFTIQRIVTILVIIFLFFWSSKGADFQTSKLIEGLPRMAEFFSRMVPPDMSVAQTVFKSTIETIQIALFGTFLSAIMSFFAGILAAENITPAYINRPVKWLLAMLRGIPVILLALLFVSTVGLGPFPGVLAIALHSTGMLGKFYSEAMENAKIGPIEALQAAGANFAQKIRFGILTQVAPDLVRDTLFRFELNLRESLILGLVGAGGIGFYILLYIRSFQYEKVATLTAVVLVAVVVIEQISISIRKSLR
ncbi:MAG: phosphonate ABC transporter, permease protein PhnE [Candidatus Dadabacteria bacterium]|nr:phosphonate ABC transporter, permease protein PhnE [Candidatus Dadabacteria bacterium]NIV42110.1 phosphonate ABC transporter, permease protein PhnE [Candidatus Dadabacteria bacterium]NIX16439.1 phosphonate ABC transporter, permease protein PhnE [Candidatus Dadabacteria bacterium]